jgi:hypothetical protein
LKNLKIAAMAPLALAMACQMVMTQAFADAKVTLPAGLPSSDLKPIASVLTDVQNRINAGDMVLRCKESQTGVFLPQTPTWSTFRYVGDDSVVAYESSLSPEPFVISLKAAYEQNALHEFAYGNVGFGGTEVACGKDGLKTFKQLIFSEKSGAGVLGSDRPMAEFTFIQTVRQLAVTSKCEASARLTCGCQDDDYLARTERQVRCGLYANPYRPVSQFKSPSLDSIANSLTALTEEKLKAQKVEEDEIAKKSPGASVSFSSIRNARILKYKMLETARPTKPSDLISASIPFFAGDLSLGLGGVSVRYEKQPSSAVLYAGLLFNDQFDSTFVANVQQMLASNANLNFYYFHILSSAKISHDGWLIYDASTGDILVSIVELHIGLYKELDHYAQMQQRAEACQAGKTCKPQVVRPAEMCSGKSVTADEVTFAKKAVIKPGHSELDFGACYLKNNPDVSLLPTKDQSAKWKTVFDAFMAGDELSREFNFDAPGVCYDLDGIPRTHPLAQLGATKRAPIYILKRDHKVVVYSHQVLQNITYGIWPYGDDACFEKEGIYMRGAQTTMALSTDADYASTKRSFTRYGDKCFTQYEAQFYFDDAGPTKFFLRKTPLGVVLVWPRPEDPLTHLENVPLLCVFPMQGLEIKASDK